MTKKCCLCKTTIDEYAIVCCHCGHYQNWFFRNLNPHLYLPILISIGLLVFSIFQWYESRKERVEARQALKEAKKAERKIIDVCKAIAKVLLAQSTLKASLDSFDVLKFFPGIMQNETKLL